MPNYVKHIIRFADEIDMNKVKELVGDTFDFNKIIKMPNELNIVSGSIENDADVLLKRIRGEEVDELRYKALLECYPNEPSCCNVEDFYTRDDGFTQKCPKTLSELLLFGALCESNREKYGHVDWYDWCWDKWGTKWNACDASWNEWNCTCEFDTAWNDVHELLGKLSEILHISFSFDYADENLGSNCGRYVIENGDVYEEDNGDFEFACRVWGYDDDEIAEMRDEYIESVDEHLEKEVM